MPEKTSQAAGQNASLPPDFLALSFYEKMSENYFMK
jgi:hypothetical protein